MRRIPQAAGLYLAVLELVFTLGWTVYAIYVPQLAASVGIAAGTVIYILMLDQAIFTITDFAMGVAADKGLALGRPARPLGRMAASASGALSSPALAPLLHWAPIVCWTVAGAALVALPAARMRRGVKVAAKA